MTSTAAAGAGHGPVQLLLPESLHTPWDRAIFPSDREWAEFVASVRVNDILEPVRVSRRMNVVSGHQRLRAARELGLPRVPVVVDEALADDEAELRAVAQHDLKSNRKPEDTGGLIALYMARTGCTADRAAQVFGFSPAKVCRLLARARQPPEVQAAVLDKAISQAVALELRHAPPGRVTEFLRRAISDSLSAAELRQAIRPRKGGKKRPAAVTLGGRVTVTFPADAQPQELVELLRADFFPACAKAAGLRLPAADLGKVLAGLKGGAG